MFKGILLSLLASFIFGFIYFYTSFLHDLNGNQAFGWRIVMMLPFLSVFIGITRFKKQVIDIAQRIRCAPLKMLSAMLLSAGMLGVQMWIFIWAPMNGRGLQVALGYFLLPIVLIASGYFIYKEKISKLQVLAICCAIFGVAFEIWRMHGFFWESALVAFGYTAYFLWRRKIGTNTLGGFWWDNILILPVAMYMTHPYGIEFLMHISQTKFVLLMVGLGFFSALAMALYILSSQYLNLVILGLLGYVEPALLAIVAFFLGESIQGEQWGVYIMIWLAILILIFETLMVRIFMKKKFAKDRNI